MAQGFQSPVKTGSVTGNSSTTPLAGGATFTGDGEQNFYPDVMASCYSDVAGTLYFDFSINGSDWRTFPPSGFTVSAGVHEFHTAVKGPRYFRARYVNGGSAQSTFQLGIYYGTFRAGNAPIGFTIADDADAQVVKSVISGVGDTTASVTDQKALQVTPPPEGKSAFGEARVSEPVPVVQLTYTYGINASLATSLANQSGTVSGSNSMAVCATGAAANSSGALRSTRVAHYEPGMGLLARFTAMFTTGVADSTQVAGIGGEGEGVFFGYNGTSFGILHRYGGASEIRTLTVSTASSTAENITITLDGTATAVAVTNSGNLTTTANEIAAHDYSSVGRGWSAHAVGDKVVFVAWDASARTGTYSLSGATTAVGTFAQSVAGAAPTEDWVAQANWNGADIFNGSGLTGVTLVPTYLNVYQIDLQYLGAGLIRFYIEDPDDGELHLVHSIEYANANTVPSLDNPNLPFYIAAENVANTSNLTVSTASAAIFAEGKKQNSGVRVGVENSRTLTGTAAETPICIFRVNEVFRSKQNRSEVKINYVSAFVEHAKPCKIKFYANPVLTNAAWTDVSTNISSLQKDTSSTTSYSGGTFLFALNLGKTDSQIIDLSADDFTGVFGPGDVIMATCLPNSTNGAEAAVSFNLTEKQ